MWECFFFFLKKNLRNFFVWSHIIKSKLYSYVIEWDTRTQMACISIHTSTQMAYLCISYGHKWHIISMPRIWRLIHLYKIYDILLIYFKWLVVTFCVKFSMIIRAFIQWFLKGGKIRILPACSHCWSNR